jgi:hypothetical protein
MGKVEVFIHLMKMQGLTVRVHAGVERLHCLWFEAIKHCCVIYNNTAHYHEQKKGWMVPAAAIGLARKLVHRMHVWGSVVYVPPLKGTKVKLDYVKGYIGLFVGFSSSQYPCGTIRVYDVNTKKVKNTGHYTIRNGKFLRDIPGMSLDTLPTLTGSRRYFMNAEGVTIMIGNTDASSIEVEKADKVKVKAIEEDLKEKEVAVEEPAIVEDILEEPTIVKEEEPVSELVPDSESDEESDAEDAPIAMRTRSRTKAGLLMLMKDNEEWVPRNVKQAMEVEEWKAATLKEMKGHEEIGTFEVVDRPTDQKVLNSGVRYNRKRDGRAKCRIYIRGDEQTFGVDYFESSSPVVSWWTHLFIVTLMVMFGWFGRSVDGVQAFTQAGIDCDVYVEPINGYHNLPRGKVLHLLRNMYGCHQASVLYWYLVRDALLKMGMIQSKSDECMFYKWIDGNLLIVTVYVDDMFVVCKQKKTIDKFVELLGKKIKITYEDKNVEDFLGGEFEWKEDGTVVLRNKSTLQNLFAMLEMNPAHVRSTRSPSDNTTVIEKAGEDDRRLDKKGASRYRSVVGVLLYLATRTRPDIANIVRELCRWTGKSRESHWKRMIRVVRYLATTRDHGLTFSPCGDKKDDLKIVSFVDASFDVSSVTGLWMSLGGNVLRWSSVLQKHVTSSTYEAEVDALLSLVLEMIWYEGMIEELSLGDWIKGMKVYEDNRSTVLLTESGRMSFKSKHMRVRYARVIEEFVTRADQHDWSAVLVGTLKQLADMLTKNVSGNRYHNLVQYLLGMKGIDGLLKK